jgi:hypothetical protein
MAKVPLQNSSAWSYMKTVEAASSTVSKWPEWKRERKLFSSGEPKDCENKNDKMTEQRNAATD